MSLPCKPARVTCTAARKISEQVVKSHSLKWTFKGPAVGWSDASGAPRPLEGEPQRSGLTPGRYRVWAAAQPCSSLCLPFCEYQHIPPRASVDTELLLQGNDSRPHPASSARKWTQRSPSGWSSGNSSPKLWSTPTLSLGWGTWESYPSLLRGNKSHLYPRPKVGPCLNCFQLEVLT